MGALDGVLVADFSRVLAGPHATMILADLGADVIKVERPGVGDDTRGWGPPFAADGQPTYFHALNRNKRSITLDLDEADDRVLGQRLAHAADIVIHNFRPGYAARWGLDYDSVSANHRAVVYCEISGFGTGAGRDLPGYDLLAQATGGLMTLTGEPGTPMKVGLPVVDLSASLYATIGILAALHHARRTGEGQLVEVNLLATALAATVNHGSAVVGAGVVPTAMGNHHPSLVPYQPFETADRPIVIALGTDLQFAKMCDVLGLPEVGEDPRFATNTARVTNRAELDPLLESAFRTSGADDWQERLTAVGVPCGPINDLGQAFEFADQLGLSPAATFEGDQDARTVASPIGLSETPVRYRRSSPGLGADSDEVRAWLTALPAQGA